MGRMTIAGHVDRYISIAENMSSKKEYPAWQKEVAAFLGITEGMAMRRKFLNIKDPVFKLDKAGKLGVLRGVHGCRHAEAPELFWHVLKDPKWKNVESDMREAIGRKDTGARDPALYAMKALESTIKIISDQKGWTHGGERGASNYIDNLAGKKHGGFIDTWEAEALKKMFNDVRNAHAHGSGSQPPPNLHPQQTTFVIECCMAWIKSLINRL